MTAGLARRWTLIAMMLVATAACGVAVAARGAVNYCDPLNGCGSVKLSPGKVRHGSVTKVYGSAGSRCRNVTLYSRAFKGITRHSFAGLPAIYLTARRSGGFSKRIRISRSVRAGTYGVGGRCGGGHFGSATLKVT